MADELRLKLNRKEIPVVLEDENGQEKKYTLKELSGAERNKYLNKMTNRVKTDRSGKAMGIKSFDGFQADLLKLCLFDDEENPVTEEMIEDLPASTQQEIFECAQKLSGLDMTVDEEEKNE